MADEDKNRQDDASEDGGWQYKPAGGAAEALDPHSDAPSDLETPRTESVEWTASEFVAHEKGFGWYALLAGIALIIAAGIYLITKDTFSVVVVLVMAAIFGVSSSHKPRVIAYKVDTSGLTVGNKFYPYSAYKSFSMPQHGPFVTIELVPLKHLSLPVGAYLAPDSQQQILEIVSSHLPMEHGEPGTVDRLMHRLRF